MNVFRDVVATQKQYDAVIDGPSADSLLPGKEAPSLVTSQPSVAVVAVAKPIVQPPHAVVRWTPDPNM